MTASTKPPFDGELVTIAGRYELQYELAHGGMGAVFCALDNKLKRLVAVKLIGGKKLPEEYEKKSTCPDHP